MSRIANITPAHAVYARNNILASAHALLAHPDQVHYTQDMSARWAAIRSRITLHDGHLLPFHSDCSGTATWMLWLALHNSFGVRDLVNGENWTAGYTGTMKSHGMAVTALRGGKIGDAIFYGGTHDVPEHVALKIGPGRVFSHGSEGGPYLLSTNYRPDVHPDARRYIP